MRINNVHVVCFSATYTTRTVVREIAGRIAGNVVEHDITNGLPENDVALDSTGDLLVVGVPVYAGRVPDSAAGALRRFRGKGTPAIAVCVYGNRDYDDALLELCDIMLDGGFRPVAAGAFIARHSIFPALGAGRPDDTDMETISDFCRRCSTILADTDGTAALPPLHVRGNRPYKVPGAIPLTPSANKSVCNRCGLCARLCPAGAIFADKPYTTDSGRCMSCGRCIVVCPQHARRFSGLMYKMASIKFTRLHSERKSPEMFFVSEGCHD